MVVEVWQGRRGGQNPLRTQQAGRRESGLTRDAGGAVRTGGGIEGRVAVAMETVEAGAVLATERR